MQLWPKAYIHKWKFHKENVWKNIITMLFLPLFQTFQKNTLFFHFTFFRILKRRKEWIDWNEETAYASSNSFPTLKRCPPKDNTYLCRSLVTERISVGVLSLEKYPCNLLKSEFRVRRDGFSSSSVTYHCMIQQKLS